MVFAPVGIRCPEHAGQAVKRGPRLPASTRAALQGGGALVTTGLIGMNVAIYMLQLVMGAPINANDGWIYLHGALYAPLVANGDWWRLITAAFLHYGPLHLLMNMLVLWFVGGPIEQAMGRLRYLLLYLVSGLAGSAGALLVNTSTVTVGASGAIFGLFGALLVLEYQHTGRLVGGPAFTLIAINLVFTFAIPGISWGGHLGGLVGGAVGTLALSRFTRTRPVYGTPDIVGVAGLIAVGILSVVVAYWRVQGLA
jgi:membrane associated rhomboid family serine protease